jgi:phage terminase large subunit-like protein
MGLRGPGAKPKPKRKRNTSDTLSPVSGSLYDQVVAFVEGLPITSGVLAGQKFKLLPWQHDVLKAMCRVDDRGLRVVRQALITMPRKNGTAGRAIDRLAIVRRIAQIASQFDLQGIAFDRWRLEDLQKLMSDEGISIPVTPWGQGFKDMGPAVDALEAAILDRKLKHGSHPVLTWNCWNSVVEVDPTGARKIDKAKSSERVDGMVALVMAVGLSSRCPIPEVFEPRLAVLTA